MSHHTKADQTLDSSARTHQIDICVARARKACPQIVPSIRMQHKVTGKQHSIFGMPFGFKSADYDAVQVGFVYRDRSGTTFGQIATTEAELRERWERDQDHNMGKFQADLEAMTSKELQSQFDYWFNQ